jgi:hypothetical protein
MTFIHSATTRRTSQTGPARTPPWWTQPSVGNRFGVPHFTERLVACMFGQLGEAPVGLHLGMQKVLVYRCEFTGQLRIEQAQNIRITLHDDS